MSTQSSGFVVCVPITSPAANMEGNEETECVLCQARLSISEEGRELEAKPICLPCASKMPEADSGFTPQPPAIRKKVRAKLAAEMGEEQADALMQFLEAVPLSALDKLRDAYTTKGWTRK